MSTTFVEGLKKEAAPIVRHLCLTLLFLAADIAIQWGLRLPYLHLDLATTPGLWLTIGLEYGLIGTVLFFLVVFVLEIVILGIGAVMSVYSSVFASRAAPAALQTPESAPILPDTTGKDVRR
jgi:hypothetical protein